jgi:hypothetical protein
MCRCIQTSAEVRDIVPRSPSFFSSSVIEWNSGDRNQEILWSANSNADVIYHSVTLQTREVFTEIIGQAEWGTLYYAMQIVSGTNLSAFLLTKYGAGDQRYVQDRGGSGLSRSVCGQWNVRRSRRSKFPSHQPELRCLCHIAQPWYHPIHTGSSCLDSWLHHRSRCKLH